MKMIHKAWILAVYGVMLRCAEPESIKVLRMRAERVGRPFPEFLLKKYTPLLEGTARDHARVLKNMVRALDIRKADFLVALGVSTQGVAEIANEVLRDLLKRPPVQLEEVQFLCRMGASFGPTQRHPLPILHEAFHTNSWQAIPILLRAGARPDGHTAM